MDNESLTKAILETSIKFNKMSDEEFLEMMNDPRLDGGLSSIISEMTLTERDIEIMIQFDKYNIPKELENVKN